MNPEYQLNAPYSYNHFSTDTPVQLPPDRQSSYYAHFRSHVQLGGLFDYFRQCVLMNLDLSEHFENLSLETHDSQRGLLFGKFYTKPLSIDPSHPTKARQVPNVEDRNPITTKCFRQKRLDQLWSFHLSSMDEFPMLYAQIQDNAAQLRINLIAKRLGLSSILTKAALIAEESSIDQNLSSKRWKEALVASLDEEDLQ